MTKRTCGLALFLTLLASLAAAMPAWAADHVSNFTISGTPFTGYTSQYATGSVTIQRDPGSTNAVPVLVGYTGSGWGGYQCEPGQQLPADQGCYVPAGGTTASIKFFGGCVATNSTVTITAKVQYGGDTGLSAGMTVTPFVVTVGAAPATYVGGTNQTGSGSVTLNAAPNGALAATLAHLYLTTSPPYNLTIPTSGSANFTIQAGTVSQDTNTTITVTTGCGNGSTGATVLTGGETNLGVCPDCKGSGGHPINLTNGNVWIRQQDYALPGLGGGLEVTRTWNSLWRSVTYVELVGAFGDSWRSTYEERLGFLTGGDKKYWREDGSAWIFRWDSINQGYALVSPPDVRATLTYDSSTTKYTLGFLDGSKKIFNSGGYLTSLVDRNGNQTTITLTGSNRPLQATDAAGRWVKFNYDAYARISTLQDSTGTIATYSWNGYQMTRATYADGSFINYTYDASNRILSVTDSSGKVLESHTYDGSNRGLTSQRANLVDKVTVAYTSSSSTRLTDSLGNITDYGFQPRDGRQFITSITGPGCASCGGRNNQSFTYDAAGNQTSSTDALGRTTTYTYDANGNVLSRSIVVGGQPLTWSYTYNSFGQVLTATDPLSHVTTNVYDVKGNLTSTTTPSPDGVQAGSVTSFAYDVKGQLTSVTDPRGNATSIFYTAAGLIDHITDAQSNTTSFGYDARANRTSVTDALSHTTTFTYNNMNRLTRVTNPDSTHTDFAYDNRGRRTSVTDANGKVTSYGYDDADRLLTVTDAQTPTHGVTSYAYDTESNLLSITDALGRTTSFTYSSLGWVTQTSFPSALVETYSYDAVGNLTSKTDRKGQTITYTYDSLDRLTRKQYPDSTGVDYAYDLVGNLTEAADSTGTFQLSYDNMGRLTGTSTTYSFLPGRTFTNSYTYDATSNRTGFTDPESGNTSYVYDSLNRLASLTDFNAQTFGFSYDALSRRTQLTRPNGVNTSYTYDNLSRLLSVLHRVGAGAAFDGATYTVDSVGSRTSKLNQLNGVSENYSHDATYQLTQVLQAGNNTESYAYDSVGNRLSSIGVANYSYNNSNQLTSTTAATYTYDSNGNPTTKSEGSSITSYAWDYEDRLASVTLPAGSVVSFKYDPFGRRVQKTYGGGTSTYVYDAGNIAEELDASGSQVARTTFGPGIDEPLSISRGGTASYYEADGLGSITSLSDSSGALGATYVYDSFGRLNSSSGSVVNPLRYTAREFDSETGIYYYRARYYEQDSGRFLGEDPLRFEQGTNFYVYVGNDPIDLIDPTGLTKCCPTKYQKEIEAGAKNARERLEHLRQFGTALLPRDIAKGSVTIGGITGCLSGARVVGTDIEFPSQYVMDIRVDRKKHPCDYECAVAHERVHERQCMRLGSAKYVTLTERQAEIPAYIMTLGCFLKMQYDYELGPYKK